METQFTNECIEKVPDPEKEYYYWRDRSTTGFTYLMKLVLLTKKYPSLVDKIKNYKDEINVATSCGLTALMIASMNSNTYSSLETIIELIKCGSEIDKQDHYKMNALLYACKNLDFGNNMEIIIELIDAGANVNVKDNYEWTPLMHCCSIKYLPNNFLNIIEEIIKNVELNELNNYALRALYIILLNHITDDHTRIIEVLVPHIDANKIYNRHGTLLQIILDNNIKLKRSLLNEIINKDYITFIDKNNIYYLTEQNNETIINRLYTIYKNDEQIMLKILPLLNFENRKQYYRFKTYLYEINDNIVKHRNFIYEKPNNIISLCAETAFLQKHNNHQIPDKLKFLFDIHDEQNYVDKINFYL